MPSDEEVRRALNEAKIQQDAADKAAKDVEDRERRRQEIVDAAERQNRGKK